MSNHKEANEEYAKAFDEAENRARDVLVGKLDANTFCEWVICANADICLGKKLDEGNCWTCRMGNERDLERLRSLYWESMAKQLLARRPADYSAAKGLVDKYAAMLAALGQAAESEPMKEEEHE